MHLPCAGPFTFHAPSMRHPCASPTPPHRKCTPSLAEKVFTCPERQHGCCSRPLPAVESRPWPPACPPGSEAQPRGSPLCLDCKAGSLAPVPGSLGMKCLPPLHLNLLTAIFLRNFHIPDCHCETSSCPVGLRSVEQRNKMLRTVPAT